MEEVLNDGNLSDDNSSEDFFSQLEADVNSGIIDEIDQPEEVTPVVNMAPETQATQTEPQGSNDSEGWEKRYKDSSREAQRLHSELNELKPFVPVLEAMKNDSGLVSHVRNYFENGGSPDDSITGRLGLDEDFVYDQQEAVTDPNSDSAKVFNAYVQNAVEQRVQGAISEEKQKNMQIMKETEKQQEERDFRVKHGLSEEQFQEFVSKAQNHTLTLDDAYYLVNRGEANANVAQETKKDMLNQMKGVRDIPTSASNANSAQVEQSRDSQIFDSLLGSDGNLDDLFG